MIVSESVYLNDIFSLLKAEYLFSDGIVRVFTQNEARVADPDKQKAFEDMVASAAIPTQQADIKEENLASKEALFNPGNIT